MTDYIFIFIVTFAGAAVIAAWVYKPKKPVPAKPETIKDQLAWRKNVSTIWNG